VAEWPQVGQDPSAALGCGPTSFSLDDNPDRQSVVDGLPGRRPTPAFKGSNHADGSPRGNWSPLLGPQRDRERAARTFELPSTSRSWATCWRTSAPRRLSKRSATRRRAAGHRMKPIAPAAQRSTRCDGFSSSRVPGVGCPSVSNYVRVTASLVAGTVCMTVP